MSNSQKLSNSKTEKAKSHKERNAAKNPCSKEQALSLQCLDDHFYVRDKCKSYFENYKFCKEFWAFVSKQRRLKKIEPALPVPEERDAAKREYLPLFKR